MTEVEKYMEVPNLIADGYKSEYEKITNAKYDEWDRIVRENYMEGTVEQQKYAFGLLNDPTIYFYAFFKNPYKPSQKMKAYYYQDMIMNHNARFIQCVMSNQCGKAEYIENEIPTPLGS